MVHRFLPPEHPWSPGHRGVDLAAAAGQPVRAPTDGVVTFVGVVAGRGVLVLEHAGGLRSTFEPVDAVLPFGAVVRRGDPLATVAATAGHCAPT
ncbi:MAG: M23 family metallopeptidase, partial [Actinomycetota bacterium]|nr:M23 family metallopeptidase [Actinomycetota bacterium]